MGPPRASSSHSYVGDDDNDHDGHDDDDHGDCCAGDVDDAKRRLL